MQKFQFPLFEIFRKFPFNLHADGNNEKKRVLLKYLLNENLKL